MSACFNGIQCGSLFVLEGMWWQALLSNLVTLTQICPRTTFAETALLCLGCWFLGFLTGGALAVFILSTRCRQVCWALHRGLPSHATSAHPEERIAGYRRH